MKLIIGKQNQYAYAFTPGNGKLAITGLLNYSLTLGAPGAEGSIVSIYDVTAAKSLSLDSSVVSIAHSLDTATGTTTYTLTWTTLPSGLANADVLLITVNCGKDWASYALQQYNKA